MTFNEIIGAAALILSTVFAFGAGFFGGRSLATHLRTREQKAFLVNARTELNGMPEHDRIGNLSLFTAKFSAQLSQEIALKKGRKFAPTVLVRASQKKFNKICKLAGLGDVISVEGFCEAQVRMGFVFGCLGVVLGFLFSPSLAVLLGLLGAIVGFRAPLQMTKGRVEARANEAEKHLPEMLDVVSLGMRSGMSFDSSLHLYSKHFNSILARELANLQQQWNSGLTLREDALRHLASTYDSVVLSRVVETMIRSVRYGGSMVDSLEADAAEARAVYQTKREEQVAKAPVKMMVPTGVLILPAMLILVLGPVLLELLGGGL